MIINGERALAYIVSVDSITPIEGADNIELAHVGGWCVIVKKQEFQPGDKAVFFEIDSKVPAEDERFKFLETKGFKIKTMKLSKFGVFSQGLLLRVSEFPELNNPDVGTDVTKELKVTYSVADDNTRKASSPKPNIKNIGSRHPKLFKTKPIRWLMKREWGRKLLFFIFGRKKDKPKQFPSYITKTDEERIENIPFKLGNGVEYVASEKLDGTSCTYGLRKDGRKLDFAVCSRNVRQMGQDQKCYHDHNIYWDMAFKYDIENVLKKIMSAYHLDWVYLQGEGVGSVQGNPLKLKEDDLYLFNLVTSDRGRWGSEEAAQYMKQFNMKWVPLLEHVFMPEDMEELKLQADGKSVVNPEVNREGLVYRSLDGKDSFKNVSRVYLMKHGG